jgi:hypothetical protein
VHDSKGTKNPIINAEFCATRDFKHFGVIKKGKKAVFYLYSKKHSEES